MTSRKLFLCLMSCLFLLSCGPKVILQLYSSEKPLDFTEEVTLIDVGELPQGDFTEVGILSLKDNGLTTKCSYGEIINRAKLEALGAGANALQIITIKRPNSITSCFRLEAKMIKMLPNK